MSCSVGIKIMIKKNIQNYMICHVSFLNKKKVNKYHS